MPLLFSYGTLQEEDVQLSTFGRRLDGQRDELVGYERGTVGPHANVTAKEGSRVAGTVFEVTDGELARSDEYERVFSYERVEARMASGRTAWVYVHTPAPALH